MKNRILIIIGVMMLVCLTTLGFFAFPVGIPLCSIIGLVYGIRSKNKQFIKWSSLALLIGIAIVVYTLLVIGSM